MDFGGGGAGLSVCVSPVEHPLYPPQAFLLRAGGGCPAVCPVMSSHPAELGCASSVAKPADGAPAHGELLRRRLESWASLAGQCWR